MPAQAKGSATSMLPADSRSCTLYTKGQVFRCFHARFATLDKVYNIFGSIGWKCIPLLCMAFWYWTRVAPCDVTLLIDTQHSFCENPNTVLSIYPFFKMKQYDFSSWFSSHVLLRLCQTLMCTKYLRPSMSCSRISHVHFRHPSVYHQSPVIDGAVSHFRPMQLSTQAWASFWKRQDQSTFKQRRYWTFHLLI